MPDPVLVPPAPSPASEPPGVLEAFGELFPAGSLRRFVWGMPAMIFLALNNKFGLGLDTTAQTLIASIAIAAVTGSNLKDAVKVHADGKLAAALATPPGDAP